MVNNEIRLIIFFAAEDGEVLYSQQKQDRELTVAQIPYNYTVEVTNRFKGLDFIECLKNYGWRFITLYRGQGSRPSPRKRNGKKQNGYLRSP